MLENEAANEEIIVDVTDENDGQSQQEFQQSEPQQPEAQLAAMLGQNPQLAASFAQFVANGGQGTPQVAVSAPQWIDPIQTAEQAQAFQELQFSNPLEHHRQQQQMMQDKMQFENARGNISSVEQQVMGGLNQWFGALAPALESHARAFVSQIQRENFSAFANPQNVVAAVREALKTKAYDLSQNLQAARAQTPKTPVLAGSRGTPTPSGQTTQRRVSLNQAQLAAAAKFRMTPQEYAKEVMNNGK
jgi:hypothetical protein